MPFKLFKKNEDLLFPDNCFVYHLDGKLCEDITSFYIDIQSKMKFPRYFGKNLDALEECLNDLDWLGLDNYSIVINNYGEFLKNESEETLEAVLDIFRLCSQNWINVPNFQGEEEQRKRAIFVVYIEDCDKIRTDLSKFQMKFEEDL